MCGVCVWGVCVGVCVCVCVYLVVAKCGVGQVEPSSALRVVRPEDMSRQLLVVE